MKIGRVYKITCIVTFKIYIGSTIQQVKYRWYRYKNLSCQDQPKIYNSLCKYGVENHIFEVIWEGNASEMLEQEHIFGKLYNVLNSKLGLNSSLPKITDSYKTISEETREKLRIFMKKNSKKFRVNWKISDEGRNSISQHSKNREHTVEERKKTSDKNSVAILQYDKENNFIREWKSAREVYNTLGWSYKNIQSVCAGKRKTANNYLWKYKNGNYEEVKKRQRSKV